LKGRLWNQLGISMAEFMRSFVSSATLSSATDSSAGRIAR
jgi:hypothetical protein